MSSSVLAFYGLLALKIAAYIIRFTFEYIYGKAEIYATALKAPTLSINPSNSKDAQSVWLSYLYHALNIPVHRELQRVYY